VIMDESPTGCWTNHHSVLPFKGQWYLFYHHNDLSPQFDKNRSVRLDSLFFNADGTIKKVIPTLRGVGLTPATRQIQVDRYSHISAQGASVAFLDTLNPFKGWKTVLEAKGAWIQYNSTDFGTKPLKRLQARVRAGVGGTLQVRLDHSGGAVIAEVTIPPGKEWRVVSAPLSRYKSGVHHLVLSLKDTKSVEIDWIRFE
jgi:hypothetical protein